jgi:phage shock protein A
MSRTTTDLQPIDRLEDKLRQLVSLIETLRAERTQALDSVARLERELEVARTRLAETEAANTEATALREEREKIRNRVVEMIAHIDKLNL